MKNRELVKLIRITMGAVCYKPKPTTISKDDVLRALMDKHVKESITDPDSYKSFKSEE